MADWDNAPLICYGEDGPAFVKLCPNCSDTERTMEQADFRIPKTGEGWRHYKGALYTIVGVGHDADGFTNVIYTEYRWSNVHLPAIYVQSAGTVPAGSRERQASLHLLARGRGRRYLPVHPASPAWRVTRNRLLSGRDFGG